MTAPATASPPAAAGAVDREPRRADATRNRAALLDAARAVLASQGLDVPVEEIARAAGVGIGTVYRNFPTKEGLVGAVIERAFDELTAVALATEERDDDGGAAFFALLHESAVVMAHDVVLVRAAREGVGRRRDRPTYVERLFDATGVVLARAIDAGAVRRGITADDVAALLIGIGEGVNHLPGATDAVERRRLVERYVSIVVCGLRTGT